MLITKLWTFGQGRDGCQRIRCDGEEGPEENVRASLGVIAGGDCPAVACLCAAVVGIDLGERRPSRRDY